MTRISLVMMLAAAAAIGCSDQVIVAKPVVEGSTGSGGGGGDGGSGGAPIPTMLSLQGANAPDEYSVLVHFNRPPPDAVLAAGTQHLDAVEGSVQIDSVTLQPDSKTLELETARQKLGVTYKLTFTSGSADVDALSAEFLSADTATFWASDFGSQTFEEYQLVANRSVVGTHGVIYIEQGQSAFDVAQAGQFFDTQIFPIETDLFTAPPDMDGNGKIVLLGLDGSSYYGGYFSPINAMTDEEALQTWGRHSNEMEMVYINVVQGNFDSQVVLSHEFQHLLYHEQHGLNPQEFAYHNEGMSECAVNAVNGFHPWALDYLVSNPEGEIASGLSLTNWQFGNYDQYALAYVFLSYVAGQLGGVPGYGMLFQQEGHPQLLEQFLEAQLGLSFPQAQLNALIAAYAQASTGSYGFNGVLTWPGKPPMWFGGPLSLEPLAGSWLSPPSPSVDYPGNQGPDIVYAGINGSGDVDVTAPFDVAGGALVVFNQKLELNVLTPEPTGFIPPPPSNVSRPAVRDPAWRHPPPFHPARIKQLQAWRARTAPR